MTGSSSSTMSTTFIENGQDCGSTRFSNSPDGMYRRSGQPRHPDQRPRGKLISGRPTGVRVTPFGGHVTRVASRSGFDQIQPAARAQPRHAGPSATACSACRSGDTLVVTKLDRLARSLPDARDILAELTARRAAQCRRLHSRPYRPVGRLLFDVLAIVAEFETDLIRMRTREGMAVARAKGRIKGKQPKLTVNQARHLVELADLGTYSSAELAELFSVGCSTIYRTLRRTRPRHRPPPALRQPPWLSTGHDVVGNPPDHVRLRRAARSARAPGSMPDGGTASGRRCHREREPNCAWMHLSARHRAECPHRHRHHSPARCRRIGAQMIQIDLPDGAASPLVRGLGACLSSVTEVPLAELPAFDNLSATHALAAWKSWLAGRDFGIVPIAEPRSFQWAGWWIAVVEHSDSPLVDGPQAQIAVLAFGTPPGIV